ncbi:hypothetical protein BGZ65_008588 [Modicella reniformis]|uniref:Uncharacterized protein n=1 Tax=Modicella reniformis TaxID=1440133 RepID=A0A9P6LQR1_9FUNG|nr:hypothetical protein BGZ65_008588 [Modicella reniformis]
MVASDSFSNNNKTEPIAVAPSLAIDIPTSARSALGRSVPPTTPLLSSSASSSSSFDSFEASAQVDSAVVGKARRLSQVFFPNQTTFESLVPQVIRARDLHLKDHPIIEGAYAEYERLYNADSVMTIDGRHMVRLL